MVPVVLERYQKTRKKLAAYNDEVKTLEDEKIARLVLEGELKETLTTYEKCLRREILYENLKEQTQQLIQLVATQIA